MADVINFRFVLINLFGHGVQLVRGVTRIQTGETGDWRLISPGSPTVEGFIYSSSS